MKCEIYQEPWDNAISILFVEEKDGVEYIAQPMELIFKRREEGERIEPSLKVSGPGKDFLPSLAEALVNSGYRDKAFDRDPVIKSKDEHLQDLRKLVFERQITKHI